MRRYFLDMDGVLVDFDRGYAQYFGAPPDKLKDDVDWDKVRRVPNFYLNLPPTEEFNHLIGWFLKRQIEPTILTGIPTSIPSAADEKREWLKKHDVPFQVITCKSRHKCEQALKDDVLVDDWEKYRHLWVDRGGVWITHRHLDDTLQQLEQCYAIDVLIAELAEERAVQAMAQTTPVVLREGEAEAMRSLIMTIRMMCTNAKDRDASGTLDAIETTIDDTLRVTEARLG